MRRRPNSSIIFLILLAFYAFLKIQSWGYGMRVSKLEKELEGMRPALSSLAQSRASEDLCQAYAQVFQQIRQRDLEGADLLTWLSQGLPPSLTIERLEDHSSVGLRIRGNFIPGIRNPEATLIFWARKLEAAGYPVSIRELTPDAKVQGLWRFEMKTQGT